MGNISLPFILSPSLGCPEFLTLKEDRSFFVIIAAEDTRLPDWILIPSGSNGYGDLKPIPLKQTSIVELPRNSLPTISLMENTREFLPCELLNLLGGGFHIFKVGLSLDECVPSTALRMINGEPRSTMYDLAGGSSIKPHAVCLRGTKDKGHHFIHVTDLHLARRNDIVVSELSNILGPVNGFNNFNENTRKFIASANELADKGELDFVLIGGDLVDFVNHGVSDNGLEEDNNWTVFIEILTGKGHEIQKDNHGIKVPVFTSTGNHDWRLHPYDIQDAANGFGIERFQASRFDYEYYDTLQKIEAKKTKVYNKIVKEGSFISRDSLHHTALKWLLRKSETWQAKTLIPLISAVLSYLPFKEHAVLSAAVGLLAAGAHRMINVLLSRFVRRIISSAVIPIEAGVQALHYYFLHVNPYMNYAFSFAGSYFIMMDTGPDCFTGQCLWDEGNKKMARLSVLDNILGGSPDSLAFFEANEHYPFGQLIWLEKVLMAIKFAKAVGKKRIFICLHAPPINLKTSVEIPEGMDEILLKKGEIDITYGTINHFLSQFFHLCLGKKENTPEYCGPKIDIVFSGHAHQKAEFRIGPGPIIFTGEYSDKGVKDFDDKKPFVVQSSACGPLDKGYPDPPYFRRIYVDSNGAICGFRQEE